MADAAKRVRSAAKGRFTRAINHVKVAIDEKQCMEDVKMVLQDVTECRNRMIETHEIYLQHDDAVEDDWLDEPENNYVEIRRLANKMEKDITENIMLEKVKARVQSSVNSFLLAIKRIDVAMSSGCSKSFIETEKSNLYQTFTELKVKSEELNILCQHETKEFSDNEECFARCILRIDEYIQRWETT